MTDLRNNGFSDSAPIMSEEIRRTDSGFGEQHVLNDNGGLSGFHHFEEEEEGGSKAKLIGGALVVALLLGAAGIYAYTRLDALSPWRPRRPHRRWLRIRLRRSRPRRSPAPAAPRRGRDVRHDDQVAL